MGYDVFGRIGEASIPVILKPFQENILKLNLHPWIVDLKSNRTVREKVWEVIGEHRA